MNALEAGEKIELLNNEISALRVAIDTLWDDFDKRIYANRLEGVREQLINERDILADKLRAVQL